VTDKVGNDWVFYHAVATKHPEGRVLMMDKISWKDGWPVVATDSPSLKSEKPVL
jgi:arabinan endo-1,5-alpha-L-arabinosidase